MGHFIFAGEGLAPPDSYDVGGFALSVSRRLASQGEALLRAPQVRFVSKTKSTSYEVLLFLTQVDRKDATVFIHYITRTFEKIDLFS